MKKRFIAIAMVAILMILGISSVFAESAHFNISTSDYVNWSEADKVVHSSRPNWDITFSTVNNHGVGRGWIYATTLYATSKYTYDSSYSGVTTAPKGWQMTGNVIWKMRLNDDYKTETFSAEGYFNP